jgi:hypothetical protein
VHGSILCTGEPSPEREFQNEIRCDLDMIDLKYGQVQAPGADEKEPCFVLRAQDVFALGTLRHYAQQIEGTTNPAHLRAVIESINRFEAWQTRKVPDTTGQQLTEGLNRR